MYIISIHVGTHVTRMYNMLWHTTTSRYFYAQDYIVLQHCNCNVHEVMISECTCTWLSMMFRQLYVSLYHLAIHVHIVQTLKNIIWHMHTLATLLQYVMAYDNMYLRLYICWYCVTTHVHTDMSVCN